MTLKIVNRLIIVVILSGLPFANVMFANQTDSIVSVKTPEVSDSAKFNAKFERILNKADRAYRVGFFRRAKRFYEEALIYYPNSTYIQGQLKKINEKRSNFRNFIFYFNFDKPDILIKSITFLIVYFIGSMLLILMVILVNRGRMETVENRKQKLRERYQGLLVDYLFSEEKNSTLPQEIGKIAASPFNRKILIDQTIDLSINLTGAAKEKLRTLFFMLKLDIDSIKKAYSRKWHVKVKGFRELAFMDITDANKEILRCLTSKNDIVRMEAQMAMVRLNHDDAFGFLDQLDKTFTQWEQLSVYETIMFHDLAVPAFERWLTSKNKSIVLFALRMIDVFKQKEAYSKIFWMLVNEDPEIRNTTIKVIGNLKIKEALPNLKRLYKTETYENCLAIIRAMAKMPDESVLNFLRLVLDKEEDVQLQIEAAMAINNMGEIGKITLQKLMDSDYKNYQIIIKHVIDKRIS